MQPRGWEFFLRRCFPVHIKYLPEKYANKRMTVRRQQYYESLHVCRIVDLWYEFKFTCQTCHLAKE